MHRSIGFEVEEIDPHSSDLEYREDETVRIYDLGLTHNMLCETDKFLGRVLKTEPFQRKMTTPEFHYELGRAVAEHEENLGIEKPALVSTCYRHGVPIFCGAPQDSSWFLEALQLSLLNEDFRFEIDVRRDVLQMAAVQWLMPHEGPTAVWMLGGGGMSNHDVLKSATIFGANGIGLEAELGSIEPGKLADLVVLGAAPLEDLRNTLTVEQVVMNGRLYEAETLDETWPRQRPLDYRGFVVDEPGGVGSVPN